MKSCQVSSYSSFLGLFESPVLNSVLSDLGLLRERQLDSFYSSLFCFCLAEILNEDGTINRKVLGAKVFGNQVRAAQRLPMFNPVSGELSIRAEAFCFSAL